MAVRLRRTPLTVLALILALILLLDVVATATVYVKRRDAPQFPDFARADTTSVDWQVDPYPSAADAGFTVDIAEPGQVDGSGRVTYRDGAISPALSAMYVIAALDEAQKTGQDRWVQRAATAMNQVLLTSKNGFLPHQFEDTDVFGHELPHPWYSSQAQGLVLSALASLYEVTGDEKWRTSSDPVFAAMTTFRGFLAGSKPAPEPWLDVVDAEGYLWFEQFTRGIAPTKVLAFEMEAAVGIYDYQRVLADRRAERRTARTMFAGALATVTEYAPKSRVPGLISMTSLVANHRDPAAHAIVERQLRIFERITGQASFGDLRRALDTDDNFPVFNAAKLRIGDQDASPYTPLPDEPAFSTHPASPATVTASGEIFYRQGKVNPGLNAGYALGALDRYDSTGDKIWLLRAEKAVRQVLATAEGQGRLPYRFRNTDIYGHPLPDPWYSSEGQGLMLSALARLSDVTGDKVWTKHARDVFAPLTRVRDFGPDGSTPPRSWLSFVDDDGYLWFEQYAGGISASAVVPGHLTALLGIYDYWRLTHDIDAKNLFIGGTTTIRHYLPRIRREGRPPWYALGNKKPDARFEATISRQLQELARITGDLKIERFSK